MRAIAAAYAVACSGRCAYDRGVGDVTYRSQVRIERIEGPLRRAYLPGGGEPVEFGVHDEIAEHYGVPPGSDAERAATLDYIVAAAAG
jgi:hypothetical protein